MTAPTKGGTRPRIVAIATSHGSSIRRRASLNTQYATASQKTARKKSPRLRTTSQLPESRKSLTSPLVPIRREQADSRSQQELPDEVAGGERETDDRQDGDEGEHDDAQRLDEPSHGTSSTRASRGRQGGRASRSRARDCLARGRARARPPDRRPPRRGRSAERLGRPPHQPEERAGSTTAWRRACVRPRRAAAGSRRRPC